MPLNEVQVKFVNEAIRPVVETLIKVESQLSSFVLDFDNQQNPIPTDGTVLDDGAGGAAPRADAPQVTGANATQFREFANNMATQINGAALADLIKLAVRPVSVIIRD